MRIGNLMMIALLLAVSFGLAGGCSNGGGGGGVDEEPPPVKPVFNLETAIDLGELSLVAYEQLKQCIASGKDAITVPAPWTLEDVIYESVDPALNDTCLDDKGVVPVAFIATEGNSIYLAFRGTSNVADAISDALAIQVDYGLVPDGGMVSGGFLGMYEGTGDFPVESDILSDLDQLLMTGNYDNLYITGHSLGAAIAALAFPDLSQNSSAANVFMYSFAGPAVGDSDFVSMYEAEYGSDRVSWRVVNDERPRSEAPPHGARLSGFHVRAREQRAGVSVRRRASGAPRFQRGQLRSHHDSRAGRNLRSRQPGRRCRGPQNVHLLYDALHDGLRSFDLPAEGYRVRRGRQSLKRDGVRLAISQRWKKTIPPLPEMIRGFFRAFTSDFLTPILCMSRGRKRRQE